MVIPVYNPSTDNLERSYLTQGISLGVSAITVDNNNNFAQNDRIMIGEMGREKTEIVTVTGAVSAGQSLTIGTTVFPHEANEPVTRLRYDQVKYYRSTTGSSGTYTLLTTVAMDVDNADLLTNYDDVSGVASYYYKVTLYNSISTLESSLSDPIAGSGYSRNSVGFMIDEILREVGDQNEEFTDRTEILGWFNEVNDDLLLKVRRPYSFLHTRVAISRVANTASGVGTYIDFPADMWKFDRLDYNYINNSAAPATNITYTARVRDPEDFRELTENNTATANDTLQFISIDDAVDKIRLYPASLTAGANVFYLYYWKIFTELNSEGDLFETPTPNVYKLYALYKFYSKKSATDQTIVPLVNQYGQAYQLQTTRLKRHDHKDAGSSRSFKFLPQTTKGFRKY